MAKIEDYRVQPNQDVIVAGKLVYSSLLTRQESKGNFPREEFVAVVENPQITKGQNTELGQYVAASCYTSNKTGALTLRAASHGPQNIRVFDRTVRDPAGVKLTNELAPDQPVELAIHSFKNANYANVGVALNAICIQDANNIQYLSNAPSLSLFGLSSNGQAPQAQNPAPTGYPQASQAPTYPQAPQAQAQAPQAQNPAPNAYPQAQQAPTYPQAPAGQAPQAQAQNPAPTGYPQAPQAQQNPLMGGTAPTGTPAGQTASTDPFGAFRPQNGQAPTGQAPTGQNASADPFGAFRPQGGQAPTGQTPNGQGQKPGNPF